MLDHEIAIVKVRFEKRVKIVRKELLNPAQEFSFGTSNAVTHRGTLQISIISFLGKWRDEKM